MRQLAGYQAFIPAPLPPMPRLRVNSEMLFWLSEADRALGRLDGTAEILPNPDLFALMYVRMEAVLSSQIEGTQASLTDVLEYEIKALETKDLEDAQEVMNYQEAMKYGIERLSALPLSLLRDSLEADERCARQRTGAGRVSHIPKLDRTAR